MTHRSNRQTSSLRPTMQILIPIILALLAFSTELHQLSIIEVRYRSQSNIYKRIGQLLVVSPRRVALCPTAVPELTAMDELG